MCSAIYAECVVASADNVIPTTREVTDSTTTHKHDGVLLKIVTFAADVGGDFLAFGEPDTGHFAKC